jgi:putative endonuclease
MYVVYVLKCSDKSLYCGITTDIKRRFLQHKTGQGGNYTRSHKVLKIVYTERCKDRSAALKREFRIKRLTKIQKLELVKKKNT